MTTMTFNEAKARAQVASATHECSQYVNFDVTQVIDGDKGIVEGRFYVSDWYDADCSLAHFYNGEEKSL